MNGGLGFSLTYFLIAIKMKVMAEFKVHKDLSRWKFLGVVFIFAVVGLSLYSNTFTSPFYFDDIPNITDNPHIRMDEISFKSLLDVLKSPAPRPVPNLSFALNYYFGKYNFFGYHLINLIIHVATAVLLFIFLLYTLQISNPDSGNVRPADFVLISVLSALIWLVHPTQTQSITYIVQRMTSMSALFYLLSMVLYIKFRMTRLHIRHEQLKPAKLKPFLYLAGTIIAGILAIGSKQVAFTLPLFIFLYEWYFFQDLKKSYLKKVLPFAVPVFIGFGCILAIIFNADAFDKLAALYKHQNFTMLQRLLTEPRVIVYYLSLLVYPSPDRLMLDYDFPLSFSLIKPSTTFLAYLLIAALLGIALYSAKRNRLVSFSILWFLGNLLLESSFLGLALIFEHRTYLPSMMIIFILTFLIYRYFNIRSIRIVVFCLMALILSVWTYQRNSTWQDPIRFYSDNIDKAAHNPRLYLSLGFALTLDHRLEEAQSAYNQALHIDPSYAEAYYNLGLLSNEKGNTDQALWYYQKAVANIDKFYRTSEIPMLYNNLGITLMTKGYSDKAIYYYLKALESDYNLPYIHYNLGIAYARKNKFDSALRHFKKSLQLDPRNAGAHYFIGLIEYQTGHPDSAIYHFREALHIDPKNRDYSHALQIALAAKK